MKASMPSMMRRRPNRNERAGKVVTFIRMGLGHTLNSLRQLSEGCSEEA